MENTYELPIWRRCADHVDDDQCFDLEVINHDKLDMMKLRRLFDRVLRASSNLNIKFNRSASQMFKDWLDGPDGPLPSEAYALLSNWFLTERKVAKESPLADAALDFWKALFLAVPKKRLTDSKKDHEVLPLRFEFWWDEQQSRQDKMTAQDKLKTLKPFLSGLDVGEPMGHLNLTLVPLGGDGCRHLEYLLAVDAIETGKLKVTEVGEGGEVPELLVTSSTDTMILLLDGEELAGAKQNRILNTTILLPARAKKKIPVSCVEQGRWRHISDEFTSSGCAPPQMRAHKSASVSYSLRATGRAESDQEEVWDDVACMVEESAAHSPTMALGDVVRHKRQSIEGYISALKYPAGARGVVAAINGQFVAMDLLDKSDTLERIWARLVGSYAIEALMRKADGNEPFTAKGTQALLEHIGEIECQPFPSVGVGDDWRFEADDVVGQALVVDDTCAHLCAFSNIDGGRHAAQGPGRIAPPRFRRRGRNRRPDGGAM